MGITNDVDALKYGNAMGYLKACMDNVLSNIDETASFDEFLEALGQEIDVFNADASIVKSKQ